MQRIYLSTFIVLAAAAVLTLAPNRPPSWDAYLHAYSQQRTAALMSAKHFTKHAPGIEFFYRTRLTGNPGVNVDRMRYEAVMQEQQNARFSFNKTMANTWSSVGPGNIAGRIRAIAIRPDNTDIVYVGAAEGGVFKSTNGGSNWTPMMDFAPQIPVGALAIDPHNPQTIFAGTGEPTLQLQRSISAPGYNGVGVIKSTDGGQTWNVLPWPSTASSICRIILHPTAADTMLVASRGNLYKSTNAGVSWTNAMTGVFTDVKYKPDNPAIVYAACGDDYGTSSNGVWRSDAGGNRFSWTNITQSKNFPRYDSTGRIILATTPKDPNLLYAAVTLNRNKIANGSDADFVALMRTSNGGATWERIVTDLPKNMGIGQTYYSLCLAISPLDSKEVYIGGYEVYRSTNGGVNFSKVTLNNYPVHVDQHVLEFVPNTETLYLGNDGGAWLTKNQGTTWTPLSSTLETIQFYTVGLDASNTSRYYGGAQDQGIFQCVTVVNKSWKLLREGDGGYVQIDPKNPNTMYTRVAVEYPTSVPARSTNGGSSWKRLDQGFQTSSDRFNWLTPMILHPSDNTKLYTSSQFVYACNSVNTATTPTWTAISGDLTKASDYYSAVISAMAISPANKNVMYVVTGDGKCQRSDNILQTDVTWNDVSSGLPSRWLTRVVADWTDEQTAYITSSGYGTGHVFKTTNGGTKWTDISANLPNIPANGLAISKLNANVLFLATDIGVYFSADGGGSWARFGSGLPNVVVYDLVINKDNMLVAGTHGRGMWIAPTVLDATDPTNAPTVLALDACYPNPVTAGGTATIAFTLPVSSAVRMTVYDISGKAVKTLLDGRMDAGAHSVALATNDLRPGVYFYTLTTGTTTMTKKLSVLR